MPQPLSSRLRVIILGAGAGGGIPQWNCHCLVCRHAWNNDGAVIPRTQSSIAVSADDGAHWTLFNASPDIRQQILATPALQPRDPKHYGRRDSPIHSVVLTNADVDHIAGLLTLREKQAFQLYGMPEVLDTLAANPIFQVLDPAYVTRRSLTPESPVEVAPGLTVEAFPVPGKVALFLEDTARDETGELALAQESGHTIGLRFLAGENARECYYIPGCATVTDGLAARLRDAALVLFDGTVWRNDEMRAHGVGHKTGQRMGHMSMDGPDGSIAALAGLGIARKVYVHINNTNPVLIKDSPERVAVEAAGWEIGYDGMELAI